MNRACFGCHCQLLLRVDVLGDAGLIGHNFAGLMARLAVLLAADLAGLVLVNARHVIALDFLEVKFVTLVLVTRPSLLGALALGPGGSVVFRL